MKHRQNTEKLTISKRGLPATSMRDNSLVQRNGAKRDAMGLTWQDLCMARIENQSQFSILLISPCKTCRQIWVVENRPRAQKRGECLSVAASPGRT